MSAIMIRAERPTDYHAIAEVNALAFAEAGEPALVDALRHRRDYDPGLSLVAESGGEIVGHALFVPATLRLGGADIPAVVLSPLAVRPDRQRQGIGGQLLAAGHARAQELGYALALLVGHDTYYPRFGYRTHMYGRAAVRVGPVAAASAEADPNLRAPAAGDLPALAALWRQWFDDVDISWAPDPGLCAWLSPQRDVCCRVLERDGQAVGYVRYGTVHPRQPGCLLARDRAALDALSAYLQGLPDDETPAGELIVPVHPEAAATRAMIRDGEAIMEPWSAGMILPLDPGHAAVTAYVEGVAAGRRAPGLLIWPTEYGLA